MNDHCFLQDNKLSFVLNRKEGTIRCQEVDERLKHLVRHIRQYTYTFHAKLDGRLCMIPAENIYYVDSVDRKTFLYSKEHVYNISYSLSQLENELGQTTFVRISKCCILNTAYLESIEPLWNHRFLAFLSNDEKLIVTRHYVERLKEKIKC